METTIQINDELIAQARHIADESGQTLSDVIEDALREVVGRRQRATKPGYLRITTVAGGVRPGINLDKTWELLDSMDVEEWQAKWGAELSL